MRRRGQDPRCLHCFGTWQVCGPRYHGRGRVTGAGTSVSGPPLTLRSPLRLQVPGSQAPPPPFPHSAFPDVHPPAYADVHVCGSHCPPGGVGRGTLAELWVSSSCLLKKRSKGSVSPPWCWQRSAWRALHRWGSYTANFRKSEMYFLKADLKRSLT